MAVVIKRVIWTESGFARCGSGCDEMSYLGSGFAQISNRLCLEGLDNSLWRTLQREAGRDSGLPGSERNPSSPLDLLWRS